MFNQNFDKKFFQDAQSKRITPEQLTASLETFQKSTHIQELADKLLYFKERMKKADKRRKQQYKELWKGIKESVKDIKENLDLASSFLTQYNLPYRKPLPIVLEVNSILDRINDSFKSIEESIKDKSAKEKDSQQLAKP